MVASSSSYRRNASGVRATLALLHALFGGGRAVPFEIRLWDGTRVQPVGGVAPVFTIVVYHPEALRHAFLPPSLLKISETFIQGDVEILGDLEAAVGQLLDFVTSSRLWQRFLGLIPTILLMPRGKSARRNGRAYLSGKLHSIKRDNAAVRHHYDVSNAFYSLWLDQRMIYSCAYFETGNEDLDKAQEGKLEMICRKLRLSPGERVLDIGSGWGGFALFAAERYGVEVLGITTSEQQVALARERIRSSGLESQVRIELRDYRNLGDEGPFDKIASIEMFEHVGRANLLDYFCRVWRVLKPGGLFLNQGSSLQHPVSALAWPARLLLGHRQLRDRYLLPDAELVHISHAVRVAERAGFEVRSVENLYEHHAMTMRHWLQRLEANCNQAICQVGPVVYQTRRLFLAGVASYLERGLLGLHQMLLARPEGGGRALSK